MKIEYFVKQYPEDYNREPFALFGTECEEGWKELILPIVSKIDEYNRTHDDQIVITQIKEKFGGLRFYVNYATREIYDMIHKAEEESYKVCEVCGSKEDVFQTNGWIKTICKKCYNRRYINV